MSKAMAVPPSKLLIKIWDDSRVLFGETGPFDSTTPSTQEIKLWKEADEFFDKPSIEELADIMVCAAGWLIKSGHTLYDLLEAWDKKNQINRDRTWTLQDDGTLQHD